MGKRELYVFFGRRTYKEYAQRDSSVHEMRREPAVWCQPVASQKIRIRRPPNPDPREFLSLSRHQTGQARGEASVDESSSRGSMQFPKRARDIFPPLAHWRRAPRAPSPGINTPPRFASPHRQRSPPPPDRRALRPACAADPSRPPRARAPPRLGH